MITLLCRSLVCFQNARGGAQDPRWPSEERTTTGPLGLASFPVPLHSLVPIMFLGNDMARDSNPRLRQSMLESPPRLIGQWNMQVPTQEEQSRLTRDEQKTALMRLKKEIYNPPPKAGKQLWLYYRENSRNSPTNNENDKDEDGKRCAICLEDFVPKQLVMLTPCNHMFHEDCIVPWVKNHGQCPVCRFAIC
ncbi:unnamed protein product [Ilex paraguariensis]|uniref:RING-type domain-containing protein n=1 Tax=Ilex paraguariensis TaxID=185542 RepID=A0ABC8TFY9_9AQUA